MKDCCRHLCSNSILPFLFLILFFTSNLFAQPNKSISPDLQKLVIENSHSQWMKFKKEVPLSADVLVSKKKKALNLSDNDQLIKQSSSRDALGISTNKYQQFHRNVPVEGAIFAIHEKNGRAQSASGQLVPQLNLNTNPTLTSQQALQKALDNSWADEYFWEDQDQEKLIKEIKNDPTATNFPKAELLIANSLKIPNNNAAFYKLVYTFNVFSKSPLEANRIYIDAMDGTLVKKVSLHRECTPGQGATLYNGNQNIDTEKINNNRYRLFDDCRGNGIHTLSNGFNGVKEVYDSNNNWTTQRPYVSAHWASEETYDYYLTTHSRNSFDGNGARMTSIVGGFCDNAFWNGVYTSYGRGCGLAHNYLVALDVVGHEWTHAVTQYTAGLVYAYEPGALNESFSDIFGTLVEDYAENGGGDYLLGEDFWIANGKMRDLSNPKSKQQPDTYCGQYWYTGSGDNGGVHINSGVQNYWFYLLAVGDVGVNDNGHAYDVTGIGADKADSITYRNLTMYLGPHSSYQASADGSVQAAADLYGEGSIEQQTTIEAWCAVGINPTILGGTPLPPQKSLGLAGIFRNGVCPGGGNDGQLGVQGVGGIPGYLYQFNDGNGWQNSSGFEGGLSAGTYYFRAWDAAGNGPVFKSMTLVEEDLIWPTAVCKFNIDVFLDNNGNATITPNDIDGGSFDNCSINDRIIDISQFNCKHVDNQVNVRLRVFDFAGNWRECTGSVNVKDNIPPVAKCKPKITVTVGQTILPADIDNGSTDNCKIKKRTVNPTKFNQPGDYPVTLTVTDQSGNQSQCTTTVTVLCKNGYALNDPCNDYDDCTYDDKIQLDCTCKGTPKICNSPYVCYSGKCLCPSGYEIGASCDDYNDCTENDIVQSDCSCQGTPIYCPYNTTCSDGYCLCPGGYEVGSPCNDGDYCTVNDVYDSNCNCVGTPKVCPYNQICIKGDCVDDCYEKVGEPCDDYDECTTNDVYQSDCSCAGSPVYCPYPESCYEGECTACPGQIGNSCNDGDPCTEGDQIDIDCECVGTPKICPPGYTCDSSGDCVETCSSTVGSLCDDGNPCTEYDFVQPDCECLGTPMQCPPGETCVDGICGSCSSTTGNSCDDGDPCTENDTIKNDCSCSGDPVQCPSGESCDNGNCVPCSGQTGSSCNDGDPCTWGDSINANCDCQGQPVICLPGQVCVNGNCEGDDPCSSQVGFPCDDGDPCTIFDSQNADCSCSGIAIVCLGNEVCDNGTCVCPYQTGASCDDGDPCTENDYYQSDCSCSGTPITCPPGQTCVDGDCEGSCTGPCDDGNSCTTGDVYDSNCNCSGLQLACPPGQICSGGNCVSDTTNCYGVYVGDFCDDGDLCTSGETIQSDCSCGGGSTITCPPGQLCSGGICVSDTTNCYGVYVGDFCDDGDFCTSGETIQSDCSCGGGSPTSCPPGESCSGGNCVTDCGGGSVPGDPCDDGNPTTNSTYQLNCLCLEVISIPFDGEYPQSYIDALIGNNEMSILKVYPNPFQNDIQIDYLSSLETEITVELIDIFGSIVYQNYESANNGVNKLQIKALDRLTEGTYFLRITDRTKGSIAVEKIMHY